MSNDDSQQDVGPPRARRWSPALVAVVVFLIVAGVAVVAGVYGRSQLAAAARDRAAAALGEWALSRAESWAAWAAWLEPERGDSHLLRAACFRRWGEMGRWRDAMQAAERSAADQTALESEIGLSIIRSGEVPAWIESAQRELIDAGTPPDDVASAYLEGHLARGEFAAAEQFLADWERVHESTPHVEYLWGFLRLQLKDYDRAVERIRRALDRQPEHELARKTLAELLETQDRFAAAAVEHAESLRRSPSSRIAKLGLARSLRKLGALGEARDLLDELLEDPEPPPAARAEMGELELATGNLDQARGWLADGREVAAVSHEQLLPAAVAASLEGDWTRAQRLIDRRDELAFRSVRLYDLQLKLLLDPSQVAAANELQRLRELGTESALPPAAGSGGAAPLYREHCAACHGHDGRADGRASRHLFPPARSFRREPFQLVSGRNGIATIEDVEAVIERGIPGTSMPAFPQLAAAERRSLAEEVLAMHTAGVREQYVAMLESAGESVQESDLQELVRRQTAVAGVIEPPAEVLAENDGAVARGRAIYLRQGCAQCHGIDGQDRGGPTQLLDDQRRAARARDLAAEPFKGGADFVAVYRRIVLGMPGTPHPASPGLAPQEVADLVRYCQAQASHPGEVLTNYQRRRRAYGPAAD